MIQSYTRSITAHERGRLENDAAALLQGRVHLLRLSAVLSALVLIVGGPYFLHKARQEPGLIYLALATVGVYLFVIWWVYREQVGERKATAETLFKAIDASTARVVHCRSDRFVAVEEVEDEGADYYFQVEDQLLLHLCGQQYDASERFPSDDFEIVEILDAAGNPTWCDIDTRGRKLTPTKVLRAEIRDPLLNAGRYPEDRVLVRGSIDDLEHRLRNSSVETFLVAKGLDDGEPNAGGAGGRSTPPGQPSDA
jgi:hypothetical protein